jgi:hypothetical protein
VVELMLTIRAALDVKTDLTPQPGSFRVLHPVVFRGHRPPSHG